MSDFPRKVFEIPFQDDPSPDIYKLLTEENAKYPLSDMGNVPTYLPDFSRAVELGEYIYRVNVPGYFYKSPGSSSMVPGGYSGIIIDRYSAIMDNYGHHAHSLVQIGDNDTKIYGSNVRDDVIGTHSCFVTPTFQLYMNAVKDNTYTGNYAIHNGDDTNIYKPTDFSALKPNNKVGGHTCQIAIRANQRRYPKKTNTGGVVGRSYGCDYIVNSGKNSCGGIMNSLVPIIPGVATTSEATGTYEDSDGFEYTWHIPALCDVYTAEVALVFKVTNYYSIDNYNIAGDMFPDPYGVDGAFEAKGTYVFPYKANGCTDKFYFVPAKAVDNTVKPVTLIRASTSDSCTPHIPERVISLRYPTTSCVVHKQKSNVDAVWGSEIGGWGTLTAKGTLGTLEVSRTGNPCGVSASPHTEAFDTYFRDIFANPSLTGHKAKFVAQTMSLLQAADDDTRDAEDSVKDIIGSDTTIKIFDPTKDGDEVPKNRRR